MSRQRSTAPIDIDIQTVETREGVEALRPQWEELQSKESYQAIDSDIDQFLSTLDSTIVPCVLVVRKSDQLACIVVARIEERRLRIGIGYKAICRPTLKCLVVTHGGFLGTERENLCAEALDGLIKTVRTKRLNAVLLSYLRKDSKIYEALSSRRRLWDRLAGREVPHWRMSKPRDLEAFYRARSHSHRSNLRRLVRNLGPRARIGALHDNPDISVERILGEISSLSAKTYQDGLGAGFSDTPVRRRLVHTGLERGWLKAYLLYIDEQPAAFLVGSHYRGSLFVEHMGYDAALASLSPGTYLFIKVLAETCAMPDISYVDFGYGDAGYKRSYSDQCWSEELVYLFALRPYPLLVALVYAVMSAITSVVLWLLSRTHVLTKVKRLWKRRLRRPAGNARTESRE